MIEELQNKHYHLTKISGKQFLNRAVNMLRLKRINGIFHPEGVSLLTQLDTLEEKLVQQIHCQKVGPTRRIKIGLRKGLAKADLQNLRDAFAKSESYVAYYSKRIRGNFTHQRIRQFHDLP